MELVDNGVIVPMALEICCKCAMPFLVSENFQNRRRKDKRRFYCPSGHSQSYMGKTREKKLQEELEMSEAAKSRAIQCCSRLEGVVKHEKAVARGHQAAFTRLKNKQRTEDAEVIG